MKVEVNGNEYDVELLGNKARINGKEIALKLDQDELTISDNKKFHLDFLQEGEPSFMIINGMAYDVLRSVSADTAIKEVKAPISGQIIDVSVSAGDEGQQRSTSCRFRSYEDGEPNQVSFKRKSKRNKSKQRPICKIRRCALNF